MIDRTKLSPIIKEAVAVTEAECGKVSDEQIELLIKKERGEITTRDIIQDLKTQNQLVQKIQAKRESKEQNINKELTRK